jgi:uncharacterized Zn finger protein
MNCNETPKSRFETCAPECPQCRIDMKVQSIVSGKREDLVGYRCDNCGKFVNRIVPR